MDKEIKCIDCGSMFFFTERDQEFYKLNQYKDPKRCIPCRETKKKKFPNDVRGQGISSDSNNGRQNDY